MKALVLIVFLNGLSLMGLAQANSFLFGPSVGIDQFLAKPKPVNTAGFDKNTLIHYKSNYLYGVEAAYSMSRILLNARLLTTRRMYELKGIHPLITGPFPFHVSVQARYVAVPLTVSYLIKTVDKLHVYAGVGVVPEWIIGDFNLTSYAVGGVGSSGSGYPLAPETPTTPFSLGGSLQLIARYDISKRWTLLAQPTFHYFSNRNTPFVPTNNSSFSLSTSIAYRLYKMPQKTHDVYYPTN